MLRQTRGYDGSQQSARLLARHPQFRQIRRGRRFVWRGTLQATPLGRRYVVEIRLQAGGHPRVFVLDPPLISRTGEEIPHRFHDGSLCLYYDGEWSSQNAIAETIVPWTATWLYYYELWLATGEWLGGGIHPADESDEQETHEDTINT